MLNSEDLQSAISKIQFSHSVDLFASRLNTQYKQYISYRKDPYAMHVDAFNIPWTAIARKWFEFCNLHNCDYVTAPVSVALDFLSDLFASGLSYSSINTAISCLSSLLLYEDSSAPFGQLPFVKRFMKGIFELRPSISRYTRSWSINTVFDFIRATPLYTLSLKDLSYRGT